MQTPIVNADPESDHDGPVGQLAASVEGDEDGQIIGWSFNVGDGRIIYCGEISNRNFDALDEDARAAFGGKPFGWFLMCFWPDRCEVWAKCAGDDEARRLVTLIGSMLYAGKLWRDDDFAGARAMVDHATA
jgi:hypothetical protein